MPISLASIAAWQSIPPSSVIIPAAFLIRWVNLGEVMEVTRISPLASLVELLGFRMILTLPFALPREAGVPLIERVPMAMLTGVFK